MIYCHISRYPFLCVALLLIMGGCATYTPEPSRSGTDKTDTAVDFSDSSAVRERLVRQYLEWQGTPHRMGGLSKEGIDCSGFVYVIFRAMGHDIPRTTDLQVLQGSTVKKDSLCPGDLIFFKVPPYSGHVGIYLSDSQFIHASFSKGVMESSLNETYWKNHYWTAKRQGAPVVCTQLGQ